MPRRLAGVINMQDLTVFYRSERALFANRDTFYVIDLNAQTAFEASAFWAKMYIAEAGLPSNGNADDPSGGYELGSRIVYVVPTFRKSERAIANPIDFTGICRQLDVALPA